MAKFRDEFWEKYQKDLRKRYGKLFDDKNFLDLKFWNKYQEDLQEGYYRWVDNKACLKPEFIVEYSVEIAKKLNDPKRNKLSQLWKFYEYALRIQDSLNKRDSSKIWRAEFCRLLPFVNNAIQRNVVTKEFKFFIDLNVNYINENKDLEAFIKHFQSVIAYLPRQNQR